MEQEVACPECRHFAEAVSGIRGPHWQGRHRAGLRQSYRDVFRASAVRDGSVSVTSTFRELLRDKTCARWLDHLADQDDPRAHAHWIRPAWIPRLLASVDFKKKVGLDAATRLAAAVLGISESSYRRGTSVRRRGDCMR